MPRPRTSIPLLAPLATALATATALASPESLPAQTPGQPSPPVVYRLGQAQSAPQVQVWVVDGSDASREGSSRGTYGVYDPYDRYDRTGWHAARAYFRVADDAYVTVAAIGSGGRVRLLYPNTAGDLRLTPAGSSRSLALDDAVGDGEWSSWGYVVALASYVAPDYDGYARGGQWRARTVVRPAMDDPSDAVEELARQLYPEGDAYSADFAFYRPSYGGDAAHVRSSSYRSCATFGYGWSFAPWEFLSPYDVGCWPSPTQYYGYYGYFDYYGRPPYVPGKPARPSKWRPRARPDSSESDGWQAGRDAGRGRRPRTPREREDARDVAAERQAGPPSWATDRTTPGYPVVRGRDSILYRGPGIGSSSRATPAEPARRGRADEPALDPLDRRRANAAPTIDPRPRAPTARERARESKVIERAERRPESRPKDERTSSDRRREPSRAEPRPTSAPAAGRIREGVRQPSQSAPRRVPRSQ